ncbi:MAG TPA: hypothetical protein V6D47_03240 [Oscillatoriaceae cyanobacterium]
MKAFPKYLGLGLLPLAGFVLLSAGCSNPILDSQAAVGVSDAVDLTGSYVFFDDFEHGTSKWTVPTSGSVSWRQLKSHTCSGDYTMLFGLDQHADFTNVAANGDLTLNQTIDLSKVQHPYLTYQVYGASDPATALTMQPEVSVDGTTWKPLGQQVTGTHSLMATLYANLKDYLGQAIHLRFHAESTATSTSGQGEQLDDVAVIETTGD